MNSGSTTKQLAAIGENDNDDEHAVRKYRKTAVSKSLDQVLTRFNIAFGGVIRVLKSQ